MGQKKFSDSYLKQYGVDAHMVKDEYRAKPNGHYDIYNGQTVTIRDKSGKLFEDTGMAPKEFLEVFGMQMSYDNSKNKGGKYYE